MRTTAAYCRLAVSRERERRERGERERRGCKIKERDPREDRRDSPARIDQNSRQYRAKDSPYFTYIQKHFPNICHEMYIQLCT